MSRVFWAAVLAGLCAFLWFRVGWMLSLPEPWVSFASVGAVLLMAACVVGIILPECEAAGFQALIALVMVAYMVGNIPAYL